VVEVFAVEGGAQEGARSSVVGAHLHKGAHLERPLAL
jgi:hypothetical protein